METMPSPTGGGADEQPRYFDHAATSPARPTAVRVLTEAMALANPSALHAAGRRARAAVDASRAQLAAAVGAHPSEVIFTSGGTEADNQAVKGLYWARRGQDDRRRIILLPGIEHSAVFETAEWLETHQGAEVRLLPVDGEGRLDLDAAEALMVDLLSEDPESVALATLMWANSEVGALQPVAEFVRLCARWSVPVHTDAVQGMTSTAVDFAACGAATMAITAHKLGGPVGVGALLVRRDVALTPVLHGGGQERDIRSGTLDVAGICAFAAVAEEVVAAREDEARRLGALRDRLLEAAVRIPGVTLRGPDPRTAPERRLPQNLHITVDGAEGDSLLFMLDMAGFATATGSACSAGVPRPSRVLLAMGLTEEQARGAQRFTVGHTTTEDDVDALIAALPDIVARARTAGMAASRSR
ncbi:MAG: cysteine desulfurase family protein [Nesterenkonia sp.]|nr:cysteine desulfurase family protein [Nesterenkonia sp.]